MYRSLRLGTSFVRRPLTNNFRYWGTNSTRRFSTNAIDPHNILPCLAKAERITKKKISGVKCIFLANQTGGKSTVNDFITGFDISYKNIDMATRRPVVQELIR